MKKKYGMTWCLLRGKVCPGCFAFFFLSILETFNLFFYQDIKNINSIFMVSWCNISDAVHHWVVAVFDPLLVVFLIKKSVI